MITVRHAVLLAAFALFTVPSSASADSFKPLPRLNKHSKDLKIRWIAYRGGTNGSMVVEIRNSSRRRAKFEADGLYFVPDGSPESAPQRLGAAGPFQLAGKGASSTTKNSLYLAPGETKRLSLDVFCIDSHRASPNSKTHFSVAAERLPKKLRREIRVSNEKIYKAKRYSRPEAKEAIQKNMWKNRDKDWVKLEGEGIQEAGK